jgi:hypothetical protein
MMKFAKKVMALHAFASTKGAMDILTPVIMA